MRLPVAERPVLWQPNSDAQRAFLASTAKIAMAGGTIAAGKTSALLVSAALQCSNPQSRAIIFRKDFPSLRQIIASSHRLFVPMGASYNRAEHIWQFPGKNGGKGGGTLEFSHLEDETTVYQKSGQEFSFCGFDELCLLPGDDVTATGQPINSAFAFMMTRLRAPVGSGLRTEIRCTGTPSGPGMGWVKNYFRVPDSGESTEFVDPVSGFRRAYFKFSVAMNPAIAADEYARQLSGLSEARRQALLEGSWTAAEGQFFSEWRYDQHTCLDFPVPEEWEIFRGADDGYSELNPAAVVWIAHDKIMDRLFVVAELQRSRMIPELMAREVKEIDARFRDEPLSGCIDSASFAETGFSGGGRGDIMNALGCRWTPSPKGPGSRASGWSAIRSRLANKEADGKPGLVIFRSCKQLIHALPMLVYSTKHSDDIAENCDDHLADALRYSLVRKLPPSFARVKVRGI